MKTVKRPIRRSAIFVDRSVNRIRACVAMTLIALVAFSACATEPRDLNSESRRLPQFQNYDGRDGVGVHLLFLSELTPALESGLKRTAWLHMTIDGKAVPLDWKFVSLAPGPHRYEVQTELVLDIDPSSNRYDPTYPRKSGNEIISRSFTLETGKAYGLLYYISEVAGPAQTIVGLLPLGTSGKMQGLSVEETRSLRTKEGKTLSAGAAERLSRMTTKIAEEENRFKRVVVTVSIANYWLSLSRPLVGDDAQRAVDRARGGCDCARGNAVVLREGALSTGHPLSLALRCRSGRPNPWDTPLHVAGLEIPQKFVEGMLFERPETLGQLYLWLREQKIRPPVPADRIDDMALEINRLLDGRVTLKPVRR